jgi:hypothetical protein
VCYYFTVAQVAVHAAKLERLRSDGLRTDLSPESRVELLFMAAYQGIEAAAARLNVHIGKHQRVRDELEANREIFGPATETVWRAFQDLETRYRPKIVYGQSASPHDLKAVVQLFETIETAARAQLDR